MIGIEFRFCGVREKFYILFCVDLTVILQFCWFVDYVLEYRGGIYKEKGVYCNKECGKDIL